MNLRIAITADPFIPVPPLKYGGIERIIDFLATGLVARGHEVRLVAHADSTVNVPLIKYPTVPDGFFDHAKNTFAVKKLADWDPDIVHSFGRLAYLLPLMSSHVPKLMSYQREPTLSQIQKAVFFSVKDSLTFTGCSNYITEQIKTVATANTVYNGVDMSKYDYQSKVTDDAPLIFLGRIEPAKGAHHAIDVAIETGRKLIIAGNIPKEHTEYFEDRIEPHLKSNHIEYVGAVNDEQKNNLLGTARALLMPIEWNEPFGIVMCEAMACGTPVIAFNRGSVPEVVKDKFSGYICNTPAEMVWAADNAHKLSRQNVKDHCTQNFSSDVIVDNYINLYRTLTNQYKATII